MDLGKYERGCIRVAEKVLRALGIATVELEPEGVPEKVLVYGTDGIGRTGDTLLEAMQSHIEHKKAGG